MTNYDDVAAAVDCGADYIGFVIFDKSPRGISAGLMRRIIDQASFDFRAVAVFVNESKEFMETVASDCGLFAVQLHGKENAADFDDFQPRIWRTIWAGDDQRYPVVPEEWNSERYVVDAAVPGMYGGTGTRADWSAAADIVRKHPVMLAGGLTPLNVAEAIAAVNPLGVDVASGVEAEPGLKDHKKIKIFIEKVLEHA